MNFIFITGMSGSGKTVTLKLLEDHGYYCVDNLPVKLITTFTQLLTSSHMPQQSAAIGIDIRSSINLKEIDGVFEELDAKHIEYKILYLDADTGTLIKRYKETRRSHPLAGEDRIEKGIERERKELKFLKKRANYIIDTSRFFAKELKEELTEILFKGKEHRKLFVNILSFGFSYGIPRDADLVFDVRFLPNPFYEERLKMMTGLDADVADYVFSAKNSDTFLLKLKEMISYLIPLYIEEGRSRLVIAIGCTGGQHRSVAVASVLSTDIMKIPDIRVKLEHRDMEKNLMRIS